MKNRYINLEEELLSYKINEIDKKNIEIKKHIDRLHLKIYNNIERKEKYLLRLNIMKFKN